MEKAKVAGRMPKMVKLEPGKKYAWCACGKSTKQPFCDGSHEGSSFTPKRFSVDEPKVAALCMCKQTKNAPYCDGSHKHVTE